jgi:hypothetical protein
MAANTDRLDPYTGLKSQLDEAFKDASRKANFWKTMYLIVRACMIIFSVLTSASASNAIPILGDGQLRAFFGLVVVLLTSFDAWIKADIKYHIHYEANDTYARLSRKLSRFPLPKGPDDPDYLKRLEQIGDEFDLANERRAAGTV